MCIFVPGSDQLLSRLFLCLFTSDVIHSCATRLTSTTPARFGLDTTLLLPILYGVWHANERSEGGLVYCLIVVQ